MRTEYLQGRIRADNWSAVLAAGLEVQPNLPTPAELVRTVHILRQHGAMMTHGDAVDVVVTLWPTVGDAREAALLISNCASQIWPDPADLA